jgi:hypothetical protein
VITLIAVSIPYALFFLLFLLKLKSALQILLLRGNHESREVNRSYCFQNEMLESFGHLGIFWDLCNEVFDLLPL